MAGGPLDCLDVPVGSAMKNVVLGRRLRSSPVRAFFIAVS
jgi:hypothetical protein